MYKCAGPNGRISYADRPCPPGAGKPMRSRGSFTVIESGNLTGTRSRPGDTRPGWLKPIDPIGDCKRKGGRIDPELRACIIP